jgi:hypothetical protein
MMKHLIYILILFLSLTNIYAEEIKAQLSLDSESKTLIEGDLIKGRLTIWPIENANVENFRKYLMHDFMGSLKLVEIESLKTSDNNVDVVELDGLFVVNGTQFSRQMTMSYLDTNFIVTSADYKIMALKGKNEKFDVLEQSVNTQKRYWFYLITSLVVVLVVALFHKKILNKINEFRQVERNKKKVYYLELFSKATVREDFEVIYQKKEDWIKLLVEVTPSHDNFLKVMNMHQFKKSWERGELEEVKISFDYIRGSFKK